jgi:hypothetical protein
MFLLGPFPWRLPANSLGLLNFSGLVISTSPLEVKHLTDLNRGAGNQPAEDHDMSQSHSQRLQIYGVEIMPQLEV